MQKLKICGVRSDEFMQSVLANTNSIGAIGLNFHQPSHRALKQKINIQRFEGLKVGVWVNAPLDDILEKVSEYRLDAVQLHGEETVKDIYELKKSLPPGVAVWKAFRLKQGFNFEDLKRFKEADLWLFDGSTPGSGQLADFHLIEKGIEEAKLLDIPYAIAGGINAYNVDSFRTRFPHAQFLDTASGVETDRTPSSRELDKLCIKFLNKKKYNFKSKNLTYRTFDEGDVPRLFEILHQNQDIAEWMCFAPYQKISEAEWYVLDSKKAFKRGDDKRYGIFQEDVLIGNISVHSIVQEQFSWTVNSGKIGYWLDSNFWNNGYMTEALDRILQYSFEDLRLNKVLIVHAKENKASQRVIEKIGFRYIGTEEEAFKSINTKDDIWHDNYKYELLAKNYKR